MDPAAAVLLIAIYLVPIGGLKIEMMPHIDQFLLYTSCFNIVNQRMRNKSKISDIITKWLIAPEPHPEDQVARDKGEYFTL